jgi:hypothetical protein
MIAVVAGIAALLWFANTLTFVRSAVFVPGKVVELERTKCQNAICYASRALFSEAVGSRQVELCRRRHPTFLLLMLMSK